MRKYIIVGIVFVLLMIGARALMNYTIGEQIVPLTDGSIILDCNHYYEFENTKDISATFVALEKFNLTEKDPQGNEKLFSPERKDGSYTIKLLVSKGKKYHVEMALPKCLIDSTEPINCLVKMDEINSAQSIIIKYVLYILIAAIAVLIFWLMKDSDKRKRAWDLENRMRRKPF